MFVNGKEVHKFKAKDSEIVATPLCLENFSKDLSVDNTKKAGLNGYVYDFSIDYDAIAVDDIIDIHNYLIKKMTQCHKMLGFIKRRFFYRISIFNEFNERKFVELYFNEQSRMQSKTTSC